MRPPELLSPAERAKRAAELERAVSREWLRFALVEAVALWIPLGAFLALSGSTDLVSDRLLVPVAALGALASAGLLLLWLRTRIRPLQRELEALRGLSAGGEA
ncbi:MAG: hypothetical protein RMM28_10370 [Thermoleophilia bacterium]|nr:hypothetical protein [Thermoleophilia bacterium]